MATLWRAMLLPIPGKYFNNFHYQTHLKICLKNLISLPNGTKENSNCSIVILMGFSQTPRIFTTFFKLIHRNNKASLVNILVTFCGKLECTFLTATMLFLYLHFSITAKVAELKTWQFTKVIINKFFDLRIGKATKSISRFALVRF